MKYYNKCDKEEVIVDKMDIEMVYLTDGRWVEKQYFNKCFVPAKSVRDLKIFDVCKIDLNEVRAPDLKLIPEPKEDDLFTIEDIYTLDDKEIKYHELVNIFTGEKVCVKISGDLIPYPFIWAELEVYYGS